MGVLRVCAWLEQALTRVELGASLLAFAAMLALSVADIVGRNLFNATLPGGDLVLRQLVLWVALPGAALAVAAQRHLHLDPANLAAARIDIRMDMQSARTGTKDVDDVMRGKDFLDVQRFGEARFASEAVSALGGDNYEARGKLTIRDVTRDVTLRFTLRIQGGQATARGRLGIKRLDYGVGRNEWAATTYVADEVTIEFTVAATR